MITKEQVIQYFMSLRDDIVLDIESIMYDDFSKSLTFKQLQEIDHKRLMVDTIYKIIDFLEKEND